MKASGPGQVWQAESPVLSSEAPGRPMGGFGSWNGFGRSDCGICHLAFRPEICLQRPVRLQAKLLPVPGLAKQVWDLNSEYPS